MILLFTEIVNHCIAVTVEAGNLKCSLEISGNWILREHEAEVVAVATETGDSPGVSFGLGLMMSWCYASFM